LREVIAAAGAPHAGNQLGAPQLAEELLEIGKRDVLTLADRRERNRAAVLAHRQVDHRGHCEPAFGSESHMLLIVQYPINMLKYTAVETRLNPSCTNYVTALRFLSVSAAAAWRARPMTPSTASPFVGPAT